jgi:predicted nuclease with RNAse H fold
VSEPEPSWRSLRRFVGVSLGGGRGKTTAVARLELGEGLTLAEARVRWGHRGGGEVDTSDEGEAPFRDDVLLRWIDRWVDGHTVVAFDAPLTLPPCVRCRLACPGVDACVVPVVAWMRRHGPNLIVRTGRSDPGKPAVTPYTQRATELLLERATLQPREALGQGMGPLAARATYLRRALSPRLRLNENLIEVHPRATLIRLFGDRDERRTRHGSAAQTWEMRTRMLERLGALVAGLEFDRVWPELVVRNVHVFHAVVSAFTAYFWAREAWQGPADLAGELASVVDELGDLWLEDGWIWAPPSREPSSGEG